MIRLGCSASNCVNYINGMCSAAVIEIAGSSANHKYQTQCETFAPKTLGNAIKNAFNTNYAGALMQTLNPSHDVGHTVKCNVSNCTYNMANQCTSMDIQIYGPRALSSNETECETFYIR